MRNSKVVSCHMPYFQDPSAYEAKSRHGTMSTQAMLGKSPAGSYKYVVSPQGKLYMGTKTNVGLHHSSFLSGGAVAAAGVLQLDEQGRLIALNNSSGHYDPPAAALLRMIRLLTKQGVDLSHLKEIKVMGYGDTVLNQFDSVKEFLDSVRTLSGSSTVELLTLLKTMHDHKVDMGNILIEDMSLEQFLSTLTALDTSSNSQDVAEMVQFLKEQDFDFTQLKAIDTAPGVSCMPLVKQLQETDCSKIAYRIRGNLPPLKMEF